MSRLTIVLAVCITILFLAGCGGDKQPPEQATRGPRIAKPDFEAGGVLLVSQAQFVSDPAKGPVPGPARLEFITVENGKWTRAVLEDSVSNVFHKSKLRTIDGEKGIVTIGGDNAALTFWNGTTPDAEPVRIWQPVFGGKHNRCRDIEVGDVDGDGSDEFVIATHDQGVVAVVKKVDDSWEVTQVDSATKTFVHEVEIGDLNGDGSLEFYVTPSQPNRASGQSQPGMVLQFVWDGNTYVRSVVDTFTDTHAKEILVTDLDGDKRDELYVVREAVVEKEAGSPVMRTPVTIVRYTWDGTEWESDAIMTLSDRQCRFLLPTDLDGDGQLELVAAGFRSGLWWIRQTPSDEFSRSLIDEDSSGFEHACIAGDMNGDGKQELYVAADDQKELRRYIHDTGVLFHKERILPLIGDVITWGLTLGTL